MVELDGSFYLLTNTKLVKADKTFCLAAPSTSMWAAPTTSRRGRLGAGSARLGGSCRVDEMSADGLTTGAKLTGDC